MNVAVLQKHLHELASFLDEAAAGKNVVKDLLAIHDALTPFAAEGLVKFAEFLKKAEEFKRTGVLAGKSRVTTSASVEQSKDVEILQKQLREIYENASNSTDLQIETVLKQLAPKEIQLSTLKHLSQTVEAEGKVKSLRAREKVIGVIRQAIIDRRAMALRGQQ